MTIDEANFIVSEFRRIFPMILNEVNAHGLVVTMADNDPLLELRVHKKLPEEHLTDDVLMPKRFVYSYKGDERQLRTQVREASLPISSAADPSNLKIEAGSMVKGQDSGDFVGTVGWNILLNNVPVCVTNWHVICGRGNDTPYGRRVLFPLAANLDLDLASLYAFQPVYKSGANYWDYALARFDHESFASGAFRQCDDGGVRPYPKRLTSVPKFGQEHYKVGSRLPICRTGTLKSVGGITIRFPDNSQAMFERQLLFSRMTDKGDSGSVIVQVADNTVTGLNFALNLETNETIANPLYQAGWQRTGSFTNENGDEIPAFMGDPSLSSRGPTENARESANAITGYKVVDGRLLPPDDDLPALSQGKLFLGSRQASYTPSTGTLTLHTSAPPPIRNVPVDAVIGGPVGQNELGPDGWRPIRVVVLFFG